MLFVTGFRHDRPRQGARLENRCINVALQEPQLAAWAGIERHKLGIGFAMAGQHDAMTGRDPGQQGREVRLRLLDIDAARRRPWRAGCGETLGRRHIQV